MDIEKLNKGYQIQEEIDWMKSYLHSAKVASIFMLRGDMPGEVRHTLNDSEDPKELNEFTARVKKSYIELLESLIVQREIEFERL